jgi:putative transcriptional regulator
MAKKSRIVLEADPGDPEDFPVDRAALDRAHMGRRIRRLRKRLGLTQEGFADRYGIPLSAIRQYEIARTMPPPAVRAYLTVIEREPEMAARALHPDAARELDAMCRVQRRRCRGLLQPYSRRHANVLGGGRLVSFRDESRVVTRTSAVCFALFSSIDAARARPRDRVEAYEERRSCSSAS